MWVCANDLSFLAEILEFWIHYNSHFLLFTTELRDIHKDIPKDSIAILIIIIFVFTEYHALEMNFQNEINFYFKDNTGILWNPVWKKTAFFFEYLFHQSTTEIRKGWKWFFKICYKLKIINK